MSFERKLIVRPRADLSSKISQVFSSFLSSIILSTWAYTSNEVSLQFDSSSAISLDHFKVYAFHLLLKILMKKLANSYEPMKQFRMHCTTYSCI